VPAFELNWMFSRKTWPTTKRRRQTYDKAKAPEVLHPMNISSLLITMLKKKNILQSR
jgi:hypothetical protein